MISQRLYRARKAAGLTLRELGQQIGLSHTAIKKYEDGVVTPSSSTLLKLARALNVRTEYFFRPGTVALVHVEYSEHQVLSASQRAVIEHELMDWLERRIELELLIQKDFSDRDQPARVIGALKRPIEYEAREERDRHEPKERPVTHQTQPFEQVVYHALSNGQIGESKAAELLSIPMAKLNVGSGEGKCCA